MVFGVWGRLVSNVCVHDKCGTNHRMELKRNGSFMVCQPDCAIFLANERGISRILVISSIKSFK